MSQLNFIKNQEINLKGVCVSDLHVKTKYQSSEAECKAVRIQPKGFLKGFANRNSGTLNVKLPLDFDKDVKADDIVEFSKLSITPYSFKDQNFVSYSVKAEDCRVIGHLDY